MADPKESEKQKYLLEIITVDVIIYDSYYVK